MIFHHCIQLQNIAYKAIQSSPLYCEEKDYLPAYKWLEKQVGFYPIFLSVGKDSITMTGYDNQWRRHIGTYVVDGQRIKRYRKAGEFPNYVLFSWEDLNGVFTDYSYWHIVLNETMHNPDWEASEYEKRLVFKYHRKKDDWLKKSKHGVQLVVPELDLRTANRIWVRNRDTQIILQKMGFDNVFVKRVKLT